MTSVECTDKYNATAYMNAPDYARSHTIYPVIPNVTEPMVKDI
jgi:hypothetical protein